MYLDIVDLRAFYAERLGRIARRLIGERLRKHWPSVKGDRLLGIGYATPYLAEVSHGAERVLAFMPAVQGVVNWPPEGPNAAALVAEDALPLSDAAVDRALVVHSLEMSENAREQLREIWRVLAPGGKVILVVPNRRGIWAHAEKTPFGYGRPFLARPVDDAASRHPLLAARMVGGVGGAADRPAAMAAHRLGVGAGWRDALAGIRRRDHRRGEQAAVSGPAGTTGRQNPAEACPQARAGPAGGVGLRLSSNRSLRHLTLGESGPVIRGRSCHQQSIFRRTV
jgi:SAM-dependent methyltransferase